jgi:hypothetical protein
MYIPSVKSLEYTDGNIPLVIPLLFSGFLVVFMLFLATNFPLLKPVANIKKLINMQSVANPLLNLATELSVAKIRC